MTRWDDWTWEESSRPPRKIGHEPTNVDDHGQDDRRGSSAIPTAEAPPARTPRAPRASHVFRRRRAAAGLAALALLALILATIGSGGGGSGKARPLAKAHVVKLTATAAQQAAAQSAAEQRAIEHVLSYTPAITSGGPSGNEVALTFDDGPGPYTQRLVSELDRLKVHATFFAIGDQEQYFSQGTAAEVESGEVIGDHTETHPMMAQLSGHDQYNELFEQMAQVEVVGAKRPRLFRPPYGSFDATTYKQLHHLHLLMVLWSVDTADYTLPGTQAIVQRALGGATPGAIILMHDAGGDRSETIAALPAIVEGLHKRGLRPVTVPQLLKDDPPPPGQPIPTSLGGG
ncbi:MAG TPA: polysaccharide deacetylase family protein [Solirubrobacteraceae bacterium]|jgi:peptidoglycan/xylan/chitin deacetylase (PgdA/CDA1 family)|nr:polysaccharide deacetylase family protein [Solirubrobacteraceae bacterium]